jgi:hypothetical protein
MPQKATAGFRAARGKARSARVGSGRRSERSEQGPERPLRECVKAVARASEGAAEE